MGMKGQDLAEEGESRESRNATSYLRKEAETERLIKKHGGEELHVNGFPGYHCLDESTTCLSFFGLDSTRDQRLQSPSFKPHWQSSGTGRGRAQR